ncbi:MULTISPECIES: helix-turn-helix domain-containing protein [Thermococcus]|uniref:Helix-turn-helix domain-containing protein n=2 Tax=Thermococcus TaxID=2263 RepID=A0A5C0SNQ0_9EURY|nr:MULTISPECIES: helix-turn-helix domain-containing protein [Thermococcus]NJE01796.1 ArsR family transcriptional regulator [Thermococcus sp. JdF3]QDA31017.1 helix-turn-helix domain-containing protein [Thermococcus indicus]QEK14499.1 helix-turn-helix domain-containing protein [Thermococcus aciditolerans]
MKNVKVLEALGDGPKTIEEIAGKTGIPAMEVRRYLLRFVEQGKVESYQKDGKLYWKLKEKDELEEEFKYV